MALKWQHHDPDTPISCALGFSSRLLTLEQQQSNLDMELGLILFRQQPTVSLYASSILYFRVSLVSRVSLTVLLEGEVRGG